MDQEVYIQMAAVESHHWWFVARRRILRDQIASLKLSPASRILEVGCGTGGNLAMLSLFGNVSAVEMDPTARALSQSRTDAKVSAGHLPNHLPRFDFQFDLIVAFDVLEHVDDDHASMTVLTKLLSPGGRLFVTVPANPWMWSSHDVVHHHKRRYTRRTMLDLFEKSGLKVEKSSYFNTLMFPVVALARLAQKMLGKGGGGDAALPSLAINRILLGAFSAEMIPLRYVSFPLGVSLFGIGIRP